MSGTSLDQTLAKLGLKFQDDPETRPIEHGVLTDVCAQLSQRKSQRNDKHPEALARAAIVDESLQKLEGVPDRISAIDDGR